MFGIDQEIEIASREYWHKVVDFLQQNWALVETCGDGAGIIWFLGDNGGIFDEMRVLGKESAEDALTRNGFRRLDEDQQGSSILRPPTPPFHRRPHSNGPIYSSGRYWKI